MVVKVKAAAVAAPVNASAPAPAMDTPLKMLMVKVADLVPYANNPRKNDAAVPRMVALLKAYGFRVPILVRGNQLVDGHLRIKAAKSMGMTEVPAIDVGDMTEAQEKALRLVVNKSVEWADWDNDKLAIEMKSITAGGFKLDFTGFGNTEITKLTASLKEPKLVNPGKLTKGKDADAWKSANPNSVSLTFHMTADERASLLNKLGSVQAKHQLTNISEALIYACDHLV